MKGNKGITLISLVVTIIVLIILASISIAALNGENSVVKQATEAQILTELSNVKEALEIYKIRNYSDGDMSDEELVEEGLLKEVFINDTFRTVAVITNLKTIDINSKLGKGGAKQDETEVSTLLDLYNVYGIDMSDGTLYYIRNGIWSIEGNKITYTADTGEEKEGYVVETINQQYLEDRKFITEWTVEAGTTITLPIVNEYPNITIEWGADDDGDGELDVEKCTTTQPTHTYTNAGTYTIKISGNMPRWSTDNSTISNECLTGLKQWGNVEIETMNFKNCGNLTGIIPKHKTKGEFSKLSDASKLFQACNSLTGVIPEDLFESAENLVFVQYAFYGCSNLTGEIPENLLSNNIKIKSVIYLFTNCSGLTGSIPDQLFATNTKINDFKYTFSGCTGLTGPIPSGLFDNNIEVTSFIHVFGNCKGITKIPEGLFKNCKNVTSVASAFFNTSITEIPADIFDTNNGNTNKITDFGSVFKGTGIKEVPSGLLDLCTEAISFGNKNAYGGGMFSNCELLETIPEKLFYNCTKVEDFSNVFYECTNLKEIPNDIFNTNASEVYMNRAFTNCKSLTKIPGNIFENIPNIVNIDQVFNGCTELVEVGEEFTISSSVVSLWTTFGGCSKLSKFPSEIIIPENVANIKGMFYSCKNLNTTIVLKATPTVYGYAFEQVQSSCKLNWASPCTEELVDQILDASSTNIVKGVEVTK